eukprot:TRINITY_DN15393_c0_g1_i2.p1 TRINITY_DN15393_c0_g1~~TRINITY_DN15393_c0_g1_i2.p1  ORF type:complete len:201 (+),score=38.03 TRINITY_DN15393_c0_g1_i2:62-664(+)
MILSFFFTFFFFQAEDGIRDAQESRGLGDVYKRQVRADVTPRLGMYGWAFLFLLGFMAFMMPFCWPWCDNGKGLSDNSQYAEDVQLPWCGVWWIGFPAVVGLGAWKRRSLRIKYNIAGNTLLGRWTAKAPVSSCCALWDDIAVHTLCGIPCALSQEAAEVDTRVLGKVEQPCSNDDDPEAQELRPPSAARDNTVTTISPL